MAYWKSLLVEKVINDRVVVMITFALRREIWRKSWSFESLRVAEFRWEPLKVHETSSTKLLRVISSNVDFLGLHYHHLPLPACVSSRFPYHFQYPPACVILSRAKPTLKQGKCWKISKLFTHQIFKNFPPHHVHFSFSFGCETCRQLVIEGFTDLHSKSADYL